MPIPDTRLKIPRLLAISNSQVMPGPRWRQWCSELGAAGVDGLQVRRKGCSDRALLALASEARAVATGPRTLFVNARLDIALAAGADGIQLPASGLPLPTVRRLLESLPGPSLLVGRSTHTPDEVRLARDQGADFVLFGPLFETPSKAGKIPARGLSALTQAIASGLPVLALGGIDASNARQALDRGAWGLAAIRWFENPAAGGADFASLLRIWRKT